jgi:hypothetical protein
MQFGVDIDTTGVDVFSGKVKERNIWETCVEGVGWWWRSRKKKGQPAAHRKPD